MYTCLALFVAGEWIANSGRDTSPVINPATGETLAHLPNAEMADIDKAIDSACVAFASWRRQSAQERGAKLKRVAELLRDREESIATILCLEEGKKFEEARLEVRFAADVFEWDAEQCRHELGVIIPGRGPGVRYMMTREPIGPVAAFTPWNFPAVTPARKLAGALAAGCTCVLKASEETPGTAVEVVRACHDAGIPPGAVNLLFGNPGAIAERLIGSDQIRKLTFTGSIAVGKKLAALASNQLIPATLELGGHGPVIVAADADPTFAAQSVATAKFMRNSGQVCTAPSRMFVHQKICQRFTDEIVRIAKSVVVGDGMDPRTQMGPMANERRLVAMDSIVTDANRHGATIAAGGHRKSDLGYYWEPTVLCNLPPDAMVLNEEPFGPVAPIVPFGDLDEAIARANALPYGLAGYVYTSDLGVSRYLTESLELGVVSVNNVVAALPETAFGGVKHSGYGREGGPETLREYLVTKMINEAVPVMPKTVGDGPPAR
jgi:succinate-semialdehyde dehydrogenase/glutarate-semialdehyde dehydrogenase